MALQSPVLAPKKLGTWVMGSPACTQAGAWYDGKGHVYIIIIVMVIGIITQ